MLCGKPPTSTEHFLMDVTTSLSFVEVGRHLKLFLCCCCFNFSNRKWSNLFLFIDFVSVSPSLTDLFIVCCKNKNGASLRTRSKVKRHQQLPRLPSYDSDDKRAPESASLRQIEWNAQFSLESTECVALARLFRCGATAEDIDGGWAANELLGVSVNRKQPLSQQRAKGESWCSGGG